MMAVPVYKHEVLQASMYGGDVVMGKCGVYEVKDGLKLVYHVEMLFIGNGDRMRLYVPFKTDISENIAKVLDFLCYMIPVDANGCSDVEDVQKVVRKGPV